MLCARGNSSPHLQKLQLYLSARKSICKPQKTQEAISVLIQTHAGSLSNVTYPFSLLSLTFPCGARNRIQQRISRTRNLCWTNCPKVGFFLNLECNQSPNSSQLDT